MTARDPVLAPKKVATGFGPQETPAGFLQIAMRPSSGPAGPGRLVLQGMEQPARFGDALKGVLLRRGTGPLHKIRAVMPAGVPGARAHAVEA